MTVTVRPLGPGEVNAVLAAAGQTVWAQVPPREQRWTTPTAAAATAADQVLRALARRGAAPGDQAEVLVAEAGGVPAGYAVAALGRSVLTGLPECQCLDIWVAPDRRGRGVAQQLLAGVRSWALTRGVGQAVAVVTMGNTPSHRLFAAAGFEPERVIYGRDLTLIGPRPLL